VTKGDKSYREEDYEIEIVGDTEMDKKKVERVDRNFSKMTLKGQREAMEAFKNSTLYSTEEEEEEENSKGHKKALSKKRKVMVESDSESDIEVLETPKLKKDAMEWKALEEEREMKKKNIFDEKLDLVQVKSQSGKTMLVERSKLQKLMSMERSKVAKMPTTITNSTTITTTTTQDVKDHLWPQRALMSQTGSKNTSKPIEKKSPVPEEILLDDDDDVDQEEKTDGNLEKSRESVGKSAHEEAKSKNPVGEKIPADAEEILLADDKDGEVTIDDEVALENTSENLIQELKRKHNWEEVESKRMRKTIQG